MTRHLENGRNKGVGNGEKTNQIILRSGLGEIQSIAENIKEIINGSIKGIIKRNGERLILIITGRYMRKEKR